MILDTSALIAILRGEPDSERYLDALAQASEVRISAGSYLETAIVVDANRDPVLSARLDELLAAANVTIAPVTESDAQIARMAYRDYGRGSGHAANLNFGDCFAYSLARASREPLLYKGEDLSHTDIESALGGA